MVQPFPAPSLRELSRPLGVTEGVSFDGSSMPMVYRPAHINSEIFELIRSSKYTPSVSLSLDSSLREGAGAGRVPFIAPLGNRNVAGDFHRPYENSESFTFYHPTGYSLNRGVTGDFHRPYGTQKLSPPKKLPVSDAKTLPGGAGHLRMGTDPVRN